MKKQKIAIIALSITCAILTGIIIYLWNCAGVIYDLMY